MPKYICKNPKCAKFNKGQTVLKSKSYIENGEIVDSGSICPNCKQIMECENPKGFTTYMAGSDNICKK